MSKSDAEFYKNPDNLKMGRRVTPAPRAPMTGHVPIRFSESVIARVKVLAARDGVTVSTWIRNLVVKEIERRSQPKTVGFVFTPTWVTRPPMALTTTEQSTKAEPEEPDLLSAVS
jgi:hypothetical protein